ncbi:MAG: hypothetical protein LIP08_03015 [Bacteroides sp.]|nr:hypothetical protein [Bacteroides sp.]
MIRIVHKSGEALDLAPGTQLEIERTNPFFNEYGEQSLPITLPPTEKNRKLLNHPDDLAGISKPTQRTDVSIQAGVFFSSCRQAILTGNRREGIETSFYLQTGAFYEKIQDVKLSTIFENKVISFTSVQAAITFVRNLMVTRDDRFDCFPVIVDDGTLNALGENGTDGYRRLYNDEARTKTIDDKTISLDPGYYITPFIRANHLLEEIFAWFGYTMADNFFTETAPFKDMVFLNNTMDTIMKAEIRYSQIVPDCMVKTILDVYRYLFNCEFIPDEINRKINIVLFNDILNESPEVDLTGSLIKEYTVEHPETFRQLKLTATLADYNPTGSSSNTRSGNIIRNPSSSGSNEQEETFQSLIDLLAKYPKAEYNPINGQFTRSGFKGLDQVVQRVGYITMDYMAEEEFEPETKEVPIVWPLMSSTETTGGNRPSAASLTPVIGKSRALNSIIVMDADTDEDTDESVDEETLSPMLCFVGKASNYHFGTILNYSAEGSRLWNYTLSFNGPDGLFETFWRKYDLLLRNSFMGIQADLLLSESQKATLSGYRKILLKGQQLLPDKIKYIPGERSIMEATFLTTKLYQPVSEARSEADRIAGYSSAYYWEVNYERSNSNYTRYAFDEEPSTIFYDPPTAAQYLLGGKYHQRTYKVQFYTTSSSSGPRDPVPGTLTVWLEPRRK